MQTLCILVGNSSILASGDSMVCTIATQSALSVLPQGACETSSLCVVVMRLVHFASPLLRVTCASDHHLQQHISATALERHDTDLVHRIPH